MPINTWTGKGGVGAGADAFLIATHRYIRTSHNRPASVSPPSVEAHSYFYPVHSTTRCASAFINPLRREERTLDPTGVISGTRKMPEVFEVHATRWTSYHRRITFCGTLVVPEIRTSLPLLTANPHSSRSLGQAGLKARGIQPLHNHNPMSPVTATALETPSESDLRARTTGSRQSMSLKLGVGGFYENEPR